MAHHVRTTFLYIIALLFFFATVHHHYLRHTFSPYLTLPPAAANNALAATENLSPSSSAAANFRPISITAVLVPNWEVLVLASLEIAANSSTDYACLFDTGELTPANFTGVIKFPDRAVYSCFLPNKARRNLPFRQPVLINSLEPPPPVTSPYPLLIRWSYVVYDSITTENDVVLFVKGVNSRQGVNRKPSEFNCVFGADDDDQFAVRTAVTSSMQEVFRCELPHSTDFTTFPVKVSLEIIAEGKLVPSVAYFSNEPRTLENSNEKKLLCASTMVYDVAKYLKEWVLYHSQIGVEKFLLYDNGSDDDLGKVVSELVDEGYDITTYFWLWPKTQEAGFSHGVVYARDACTWMMYVDVDEFVYSPSWDDNVTLPSKSLLHTLVSSKFTNYGQISIGCLEFGPSGQEFHPVTGVTQGYNCRRKMENRHKSMVLLDAVDDSLLNVIHHFTLKEGYKTRKPSVHDMAVNHYKYQAWPEFKAKFRRRVSAYVLDWTQKLNPSSNDRTPGLGFSPVEPPDWPQKFCEVYDNRLRELILKWFGTKSGSGNYQLAWQR